MKSIKILCLAACLASAFSCGKGFGDVNIDPNRPDEVPAAYLLTNAQKQLADQSCGTDMCYFGFLWGQYFSQNNYTEESRFLARPEAVNARWEWYFTGALQDLAEAKRLVETASSGDAAADANRTAVLETLLAMRFHEMTDIFGPIPYSDALKGAASRTPKYDDQKAIYLDLLRRLKAAADQIDESAPSFGDADLIYFGDAGKWKKLANSMRLRVAMRMADVAETEARAEVEAAFAAAFSSNADNAYFHYLSERPNSNLLNQFRTDRIDADYGMSKTLIDETLLPLNDPRLASFADEKEAGGGYVGRPFGQSSATAAALSPDDFSQPSGAKVIRNGGAWEPFDIIAPDALGRFMSYAEVCFIGAEARERGWSVGGTAAEWYEKGVAASLDEWGTADATAYLAQPAVAYATAAGDWRQKIGVQKWIALYLQNTQGWSEWRRLDFQKFVLPVDGFLEDPGSKNAPSRLTYPVNEQAQNAASYQTALGLLGGPDAISTRVWWDKN